MMFLENTTTVDIFSDMFRIFGRRFSRKIITEELGTTNMLEYCTFDLNWQPSRWKQVILLSLQ